MASEEEVAASRQFRNQAAAAAIVTAVMGGIFGALAGYLEGWEEGFQRGKRAAQWSCYWDRTTCAWAASEPPYHLDGRP